MFDCVLKGRVTSGVRREFFPFCGTGFCFVVFKRFSSAVDNDGQSFLGHGKKFFRFF